MVLVSAISLADQVSAAWALTVFDISDWLAKRRCILNNIWDFERLTILNALTYLVAIDAKNIGCVPSSLQLLHLKDKSLMHR